jgi:hypothetical protein
MRHRHRERKGASDFKAWPGRDCKRCSDIGIKLLIN